MPRFRTLDDLDVANKRVLLRADLNVPVKDGKVTDATRIERLAPTIEALIAKRAKVIVMSHFGRPKGPDPALSLRPLVEPLSRAIGGRAVHFAPDCIGAEAERVVAALKPGEVALLENLRFHKGEEANDPAFARALADAARAILAHAEKRGCEVILPVDAVTAEKLEPGVVTRTVGVNAVPPTAMILDVGPETVARIAVALEASRTLVWNGPVGAFETSPFERATVALAKKAAELTRAGKLMSVAGGGDTVAALAMAGVMDQLSYVSTAGGAFLEWLEGRELPGVKALEIA